jgi:AraC-like DNA-binding protein
MLRGEQDRAARWTCAVFCLSVAAFAVHSGGAESRALGPFLWIASLLSAAGTGYFWLFAVTLFGERRFSWSRLAPIALLTAVAAIGWSLPRPTANGVWVVHNVLELALVAHVFVVIAGSWRGDLVESRRSLRGPFIAAVALYAVVLSGFEIAEALGTAPAWAGIAQGRHARRDEPGRRLRPARRAARALRIAGARREPEAVDPRDRLLLAKLEHETRVERIWRREGLTIGALATAVGVPEHRLRRLINDGLGHRNFSDFLNAHRIAAAKQELADPLRAGALGLGDRVRARLRLAGPLQPRLQGR